MSEETELKYYSLEEIKIYNGKNNGRVWIVYKNGVYDVTDFLVEHPGGDDLIKEYAGKDATKAFNDTGHSSHAKKTLKKFKIGEVDEKLHFSYNMWTLRLNEHQIKNVYTYSKDRPTVFGDAEPILANLFKKVLYVQVHDL